MTRAILVCLAVSASGLSAQQPAIVGSWKVTYPAGMRIENGVATPMMATGVLTVAAKDDSLVGDLVTNPTPDMPSRPPARLSARTAAAGEIVFTSSSEATLTVNGEERKTTVVSTWKLAVRSDSLTGTVERKLEGFPMGNQEPRPVTGVRSGR